MLVNIWQRHMIFCSWSPTDSLQVLRGRDTAVGFEVKNYENKTENLTLAWWHIPAIPALGIWETESQKLSLSQPAIFSEVKQSLGPRIVRSNFKIRDCLSGAFLSFLLLFRRLEIQNGVIRRLLHCEQTERLNPDPSSPVSGHHQQTSTSTHSVCVSLALVCACPGWVHPTKTGHSTSSSVIFRCGKPLGGRG